jgi:hypothetical protein
MATTSGTSVFTDHDRMRQEAIYKDKMMRMDRQRAIVDLNLGGAISQFDAMQAIGVNLPPAPKITPQEDNNLLLLEENVI